MPTVYELLGRKEEAFQNLKAEYENLLNELHLLKTGQIDLDRISVDLRAGSWHRLSTEEVNALEHARQASATAIHEVPRLEIPDSDIFNGEMPPSRPEF